MPLVDLSLFDGVLTPEQNTVAKRPRFAGTTAGVARRAGGLDDLPIGLFGSVIGLTG